MTGRVLYFLQSCEISSVVVKKESKNLMNFVKRRRYPCRCTCRRCFTLTADSVFDAVTTRKGQRDFGEVVNVLLKDMKNRLILDYETKGCEFWMHLNKRRLTCVIFVNVLLKRSKEKLKTFTPKHCSLSVEYLVKSQSCHIFFRGEDEVFRPVRFF